MKRILIICHDVPYPPIHGGRVDMWNRLRGLKELGYRVFLLISPLADEYPTEHNLAIMKSHTDALEIVVRRRRISDLLRQRYPYRMNSFEVRGKEYEQLKKKVQQFSVQAVLLEGWHWYLTAKRLSNDLQLPLIYRSQNVEFLYLRDVLSTTRWTKRFRYWTSARNLQRAEEEIRRVSDVVLDISEQDASYRGIESQSKLFLLPPTWNVPTAISARLPETIDVLFVGNLGNSNNANGLLWFCNEVIPKLKAAEATLPRVVFAGAKPGSDLLLLCNKSHVDVISDPVELESLYAQAKVLVNPVFAGSGISMKMIEMLASGKPVIASSVGLRGIPDSLKRYVHATDDPGEFASAIIAALNGPANINLEILLKELDSQFGLSRLERTMNQVFTYLSLQTEPH